MRLALLALLAFGCALPPPKAPSPERERCYDAADTAAQARIDRECPGRFSTCPSAAEIIAELKAAQESCP